MEARPLDLRIDLCAGGPVPLPISVGALRGAPSPTEAAQGDGALPSLSGSQCATPSNRWTRHIWKAEEWAPPHRRHGAVLF